METEIILSFFLSLHDSKLALVNFSEDNIVFIYEFNLNCIFFPIWRLFLKQIERNNWGPNFDFHFFPSDFLVAIFYKLKAI